MQQLKWMLFGGVWSDTYEEYSDGGPKCYEDMTITFRVSIAAFSVALSCLIYYKCLPAISQSRELNRGLDKKPNIIEILVGLICWGTYLVQLGYKLYTGRGMFINNPCHFVLLMQGYLCLFPKTKFSGFVFICMLRWLYGVFSALKFPVTTGMHLPLEVEFFWIEHLVGAFLAPLALTLSGRYFFWEWKTFPQHQLIGFYSHIFYQRIYMLPLSLLTWANLNYTLCRPDSDPFYPIIGNWYYILSEIYLNLISVVAVLIVGSLTFILRIFVSKQKIE